ncbi:hypothetical protein acdb102_15890 [Acidothermaceae bacterium B102]|nr:hypothetical protein acdb102_15890 [Acidothermaceae bacterium B102]
MTSTLPDTLQPLSAQLASPQAISAHAKNTVRNVLDSYTGRFDVLAEAVQNSMDALEKRWGSVKEFGDETPKLVVHLNATNDEIIVRDNGVGIESSKLLEALVPHLSPKWLEPGATRGHKGVGTTFLAYGHKFFEISTKVDGADPVAYALHGGLAWVSDPTATDLPEFKRVAVDDELQSWPSGTCVRVQVGEETRFGRIAGQQYNTLKTWSLVLRTFTAVGTVAIGLPPHKRPEWLQALQVDVRLSGVSGSGTRKVEPTFQFPHLDTGSKISLQQLASGQTNPNSRYEMLYLELDNAALEQMLAGPIQELVDSPQPENQEILNLLRLYDTSVYVSWAHKNTWYEDLYRTRLGQEARRYQYNNVRSGLLVASVGMPIGETGDHPYVTMKPEFKRRMFVVASFNENYSPDLGRKTIPSRDRALLDWLERQLQGQFLRWTSRLIKENDDSPHNAGSFSQAREQLAELAVDLRSRHEKRQILGIFAGFDRAPAYESELVGQFISLITAGYLQGYTLLAVPGSATRFDGLFDFTTSNVAVEDEGDLVPLGIATSAMSAGAMSRKGKWLEFKLRLEDLVDDFAADEGSPSKKFFELLDLAVVWAVPLSDAIGDYDLARFDESNWQKRNFYGSTHRLTTNNSQHAVEIVALQDLIPQLLVQGPAS